MKELFTYIAGVKIKYMDPAPSEIEKENIYNYWGLLESSVKENLLIFFRELLGHE